MHRANRRLPIPFLFTATLAAMLCACSDDDDGGDGGPAPVEEGFTARLDRTQETPTPVTGTRVRVTVTNRAPDLGTFQTPVWIGFHDGTFDTHELGAAASGELERLAEDGDLELLQESFRTQAAGNVQGTLEGVLAEDQLGPIAPGETVVRVFELDPAAPENAFFSYASMVIPSNDAFVANDDPQAHPIFDAGGNFVAVDFVVPGTAARDAGTEVNDEIPVNTGFFGQTTPDTGVDEGGVVAAHTGFLPAGSDGILDDPRFTAADFTVADYEFLEVRFDVLGPAGPSFGVATAELTDGDTEIDFEVEATGLSGPATAAHFHTGALGVAGPIVLDIGDTIDVNTGGDFHAQGSLTVPAGFATDLRNGNIYVNVHTALNPTGEIRGQLSVEEAFVGSLDSVQEVPTPKVGQGVRVIVTNRAPELGTFQSPVWVGFHDGTFDIHDPGSQANLYFSATDALESLAEDGDPAPLSAAFTVQGFGAVQGVLEGVLADEPGPLAPGETATGVFRVDPLAAQSRFLSYASMILPSNDAFTSDGDPIAHPIFNAGGTFVATDFTVLGTEGLDAGTEVNDELPDNTFFFGQTTPGTGVDENGVVALHPGFLPAGSDGILDDPRFTGADFTQLGYELLHFRFRDVEAGDPPSGSVVARLNAAGTEIDFAIVARGLSGPASDMHFHEGPPGVAGPVVIPIFDTIQVNEAGMVAAQGTKTVAADFIDDLRAGQIYVNIHTALNPTGEIRGQVLLTE